MVQKKRDVDVNSIAISKLIETKTNSENLIFPKMSGCYDI